MVLYYPNIYTINDTITNTRQDMSKKYGKVDPSTSVVATPAEVNNLVCGAVVDIVSAPDSRRGPNFNFTAKTGHTVTNGGDNE